MNPRDTTTISAVLDGYERRDPRIVEALDAMKALAYDMRTALHDGKVALLGQLVGEHWTHQRALHPGISTARIDAIQSSAHECGALGMKALGASGGGCVVIIAPADAVARIDAQIAPLAERLRWQVDQRGVTVTVQ